MAYGDLTRAQKILIEVYMMGGPQYKKEMIEVGAATGLLTKEQQKLAIAQARTTQRTWLQNQALFTARRFLFYGTLATVGITAAIVRMGFAYDSALNQAQVALQPVITNTGVLKKELGDLYRIAALTPFQFKDVTIAFRTMYAGFRPLNISMQTTNQTIQAITDALSYAGKVTPAALNRVSVALLHMAYMGRPAGQTIIQLARDGLPIYSALHKELGLTEAQMKSIGSTGITAIDVIKALNKYVETTPGFAGAALRQSNKTLVGAWTTFKDLLSQASGQSQRGIFDSVRRMLYGVNKQLAVYYNKQKPITITNIAEAFDKQLSPKTHTVIRIFTLFEYILKGIIGTLMFLVKAIATVLGFFDLLGSHVGGHNMWAVRTFGKALGILLGTFIGFRVVKGILLDVKSALWLFIRPLGWLIKNYNQIKKTLILIVFEMQQMAIWAWANPYVLLAAAFVVLIATLIILYYRWKWFHNLVNNTFDWIMKHWKLAIVLLTLFGGPIGLIVAGILLIYKTWKRVYDLLKKIWDIMQKIAHPLKALGFGSNRVSSVSEAPSWAQSSLRRQMAASGNARAITQSAVAATPNISNQLIPQSSVTQSVANYIKGDTTNPIVVQLVVDRKILAEQVARANQDKRALK
jgi:tape measure domain-containing protein